MSDELKTPWPGLCTIAPRHDLWPVLAALRAAPEQASTRDWEAAGLPSRTIERVRRAERWCAEALRADQPDFPERLRGVPYGPVALSTRGCRERLAQTTVGIVGARACTATGRAWARRIASAVVRAGGVVVSGLAYGIDAEAHDAAEGQTIAVLGCGLEARLPDWQTRLRDGLLARGGLVVSEFAPHQTPAVWTFPVRNRVLAALSDVVVVVEAGARSGATITARIAAELGREVLAVPGPPDALASVGCLDLIAEGAGIVRGADTVLDAARLTGPGARLRSSR